MMGEFSLYVTSVTNSGSHISFHAQLDADKFAALDSLISQNQAHFEQSKLGSPYELRPGEVVLVQSASGGAVKWHRGRVVGLQAIELGTVSVEYIDYGTNELAHFSQICAGRSAITSHILAQPALAVPCVLAEVVPALGSWSDAAFSYADTRLRSHQPIQAQLLRQDSDGVWHVRVFTSDGNTLASQLVALGLGRLAPVRGQYPGGAPAPSPPGAAAAVSPAVPASPFASRVKELTSVPPPPGSEALVTICHYISGPTKFAIQLHDQRPALQQLMSDIQSYCQGSPAVPLSAVESGIICLGSSATREGRFLRGVITQANGNVVKVYWADYGNDETKVASELRAMPRQFAQLRIQASRVSLAGLSGLTAVEGRCEPLFRQLTEGSVLTGRFAKPAGGAAGTTVCLNQVELLDMGVSVLDLMVRAGAYERHGGSTPTPTPTTPTPTPTIAATPPATSRRAASPPSEPPPLTPGTHAEVKVVSVTSVSSLHVRPLDTEPLVQQMLERLTDALNISACPLTVDRVAKGVVCAAFKQDAGYQRARIVTVGRRDMKVLYIDLGTSEIIPTGSAFALEPTLAGHPPQAVHCCLSGLELSHGTPELVDQLRSMTAGGRLLCEVQDQLGDKRIVRLSDMTRRPPLDVGAAMQGLMAAGRRVQPSTQTQTPSPRKAAAAVTVRPPEVALGRPELITVVHVESAEAFFGQLMSVDADAVYNMEEAMQNKYGGSVAPLKPANVADFCVAKSSINEMFYRAKILSVLGDKVTIQYIDYGDRETKSPAEVLPLLSEFSSLPQLGLFCALSGGGAVPADAFCQLVQDQQLEVVPVSGSGTHYSVSLTAATDNQSLLTQLRPFGVHAASSASSAAAQKLPGGPSGAAPVAAGSPVTPGPAVAADVPVDTTSIQLPIGLFKDVSMAHVVTLSEFYVRLREHSDALARLEAEMATYGCAPPAPVAVRQTVAVETGDRWRRGRVIERRVDQVSVFLLDSGETVTAPLSAVRPLRPEHAQLPAQAVRCAVKGARPANSSGWTDEETARFRGAMERSFLARAEEVQGGTAMVLLAQAEPVKAGTLLSAAARQSPRPADSNNNNTKRVSPPPRADQDRNWRDKSTAVPPPSTATSSSASGNWRATDSRPNGGVRTTERRPSGGSAPAPAQPAVRPHRTDPERRSGPATNDEPEPELDPGRFSGKMRMDDPAEYAPRSRSAGRSWGDTSSGSQPSSRPNNNSNNDDWDSGDSNKPARTAAKPAAPAPVTILAHSATIARRPVPAGEPLAVTPTWVAGLGRFYVQRRPAEPAFTTLMEEMQRFYGGLRADDGRETDPQPGKPVAARFTDGAWYRAAVRSSSAAELRVLFVDYGNCELVPPGQVKRLKEDHCRLPAQVYCCRFAGVQPAAGEWKALDESQLVKYFSGEMTVTAVGGASGSVSAVEVTLAGQKVTDLLVADGLAVRQEPAQALTQQHPGPFTGLPDQFRAGDRLSVFVCYIASPSRLFCQLAANGEAVEELETQIVTASESAKPVGSAPAAGAGCLAPFEGTFYRGVVVDCPDSGGTIPVHFIDYGNTETVPAAELLQCPEPLLRLPAQAVRLSLTGVPADSTDKLTARADQMELVAHVDGVSSDHLDVTLFDGKTNINLELGGTAPAPAPATAAATTPTTAPKRVTFAPSEESRASPTDLAVAEPRRVSVSFTVSPAEFYIQETSSSGQLDELMTQLETEYTELADGERAVREVQPGDLLAAPFSEDGAFYRARVVAADDAGSQLLLQFIDYGNSEWSAQAGCRLLTPSLLAPAPFARRCRLAGAAAPAGGWAAGATAALDTLTGAPDGEVTMVTVEDGGDCWAVRLTGLGGEDVAEALVKDGHAAAEKAEPAVPDAVSTKEDPKPASGNVETAASSAAVPAVTALVPGKPVTVAVAFSRGPCDFWVQLVSDLARLDSLVESLEAAAEREAGGELPVAESPSPGDLVAVRYAEDGTLYRARVLADSDSAESRRVLFIDYGNTESVPTAELRRLPAELVAERALAVHCSLPVRPAEGAELEAVEGFAELADGELELELTLMAAGDPMMVTLTHEGRDLAEMLVGDELAVAVPVETEPRQEERQLKTETALDRAEDTQTEPEGTESRETDGEKQSTDENQKTDISPAGETPAPSQMEDPGNHEVLVSHVNSPLEFYVQSPDTTELDDLMERLSAADASLDPAAAAADPAPSHLLAAPFSEDGALYRARLLSVADGRARVLFVDYGNGETVDVTALRELPAELGTLPPQALRCRLPVEGCAAAATDRFREMTEDGARLTRLAASADADGPVMLARLTVAGEDVAETLSAAGLCRPARRLTLPPALPPPLGADMAVRMTHREVDGDVYLVPDTDETALRELRQMIAELYGAEPPPPALAAPAADDLCLVIGPDGEWHRAAVSAVNPEGTARVRLVDSGAALEVPLAQLRQPLQAVALLPPLARCCRLAPGPDGHVPSLGQAEESCRGSDETLTVRLTSGDGQLLVHLSTDGTLTDGGSETPQAADTTEEISTGMTEDTVPTVEASEVALASGDAQTAEPDGEAAGKGGDDATEADTLETETPASESRGAVGDSEEERPAPIEANDRSTRHAVEDKVQEVPRVTGPPAGTPLGRHISHEYKIVPGQISFSLLTDPESKPETEAPTGAGETTPNGAAESELKEEVTVESNGEMTAELGEVAETKSEQDTIATSETAATKSEVAVVKLEQEDTEAGLEEAVVMPQEVVAMPEEEETARSEQEEADKPEEEAPAMRAEVAVATREANIMPEEAATEPKEVAGKPEAEAAAKPDELTAASEEEAADKLEEEAKSNEEATAKSDMGVTSTPEEEVPATPEGEATDKGEAEVAAIPEQVTATPEETTAKSEEATGMPKEEATVVPEEEATAKPEEEATAKPEEEMIVRPEEEVLATPEEVTVAHEEEVAVAHEEEVAVTPELEVTATPEEVTVTHEGEVAVQPEEMTAKSGETTTMPEEEATVLPGEEATAKPEPEVADKLEDEATAKPDEEVTVKPEEALAAKPEEEVLATPEEEVTVALSPAPVEMKDRPTRHAVEDEVQEVASVAGPPAGTPLGRHVSHEYKIVPGQISFSLLTDPESKSETETPTGAGEITPNGAAESELKEELTVESNGEMIAELGEVAETKSEQEAIATSEETAATKSEVAVVDLEQEIIEAKLEEATVMPQEEAVAMHDGEETSRPEQEEADKPEEEAAAKPDEEVTATPEEVPATPEEEVTAKPEEEVTAKPEGEVSATPEEEVPVTPEEEVPVTPEEEVFATPEEEVFATPEEEVPVTPEEEVPATPEEEVPATPEEEVTATPEEEMTAKNEEDVAATPEEATAIPKEKATVIPGEEATAKPEQEIADKPQEEATAKLEGEVTAKPEEVVAAAPDEEVAVTHEEEATAKSDKEVAAKPEGEVAAAPGENVTATPDGEATVAPGDGVAAAPEEEVAAKPEEGVAAKPEEEVAAKPEEMTDKAEQEEIFKREEEATAKPETETESIAVKAADAKTRVSDGRVVVLVTETVEYVSETPLQVTLESTEETAEGTAVTAVTDTATDEVTVRHATTASVENTAFKQSKVPKASPKCLAPIVEVREEDEHSDQPGMPAPEPAGPSVETSNSSGRSDRPSGELVKAAPPERSAVEEVGSGDRSAEGRDSSGRIIQKPAAAVSDSGDAD